MTKPNVELWIGVLIGMGIILIVLGFLAWNSVSYMYGRFSGVYEDIGLDPSRSYIFRELNQEISQYMMFVVAGFVSVLFGVLFERKRILKVDRPEEIPHPSSVAALWGSGGALALYSLSSLFYYLLTSDYFSLESFIAFAAIGIFLIILGAVIYIRRKTIQSKPQT